ncbi:hypothetical protein L211DRAFT_666254 [Terfezia boudieri ATCC MYA-4762]|uniref:Uncharacterized protein n=1 Tax=Terfezia boudieri ATCC MYA-4762 TaxID=1051890 RepID=A0A3N4LCB4_9PEZI|nr:hypothetical protein L211DRAFT_666254 [Terfezia boudieri ATCC MYA-4762]
MLLFTNTKLRQNERWRGSGKPATSDVITTHPSQYRRASFIQFDVHKAIGEVLWSMVSGGGPGHDAVIRSCYLGMTRCKYFQFRKCATHVSTFGNWSILPESPLYIFISPLFLSLRTITFLPPCLVVELDCFLVTLEITARVTWFMCNHLHIVTNTLPQQAESNGCSA